MSKLREERQKDLFRPAPDQFINMATRRCGWLRRSTGGSGSNASPWYASLGRGRPPLPARLVAGLFILRRTRLLSDDNPGRRAR